MDLRPYLERNLRGFEESVLNKKFATSENVENSLLSGYIDFTPNFELGFINNNNGNNSASNSWVRTDFFKFPQNTKLYLSRVNAQKNVNTVWLYTYDLTKTFVEATKVVSSYSDDNIVLDLNSNNYYKMAIGYSDPSTIYDKWAMRVETALTSVVENKSHTVARLENMTPKEFNSRSADDNAMLNGAQYNIYTDNYSLFHNGKLGGYISEREYLCKFALLSDAHIGGAYYDNAKKTAYLNSIAHINSLGLDFAVELGDNVDNGYSYTDKAIFDEQIAEHIDVYSHLDIPLFSFGGNHDTGVAKFSPYGTIDFNGVRLIKFHADYVGMNVPSGQSDTVWSTGIVSDEQLQYLNTQLAESKAQVNIVACHYPIATDDTYTKFKWWIRDEFTDKNGATRDGHRDDLLQILNNNNIKLYLSGHEHTSLINNWGIVDNGINNYNSPSFQTAYTIVTVKANEVVFDYYDLATNTSQGTRTISLVN